MDIFNVLLVAPLANGLIVFYRILGGNLGLAIIGFSLALRLLLEPLTRPYMKSMKKMREYGPQLAKLKEKHKGDKQKQMQAQSEFYKQKGINPGAGCLPYLLQIVVLIALFNVFSQALTANGGAAGKLNNLLYEPLKFATGQTINADFLGMDLTKPNVLKVSFLPFALPGVLLILSAVVQMVSAKISAPVVAAQKKLAKKTVEKSDDFATAMQSSAIYTFPLMTILFGMNFPSGLVIYWLLFSIYQAVQQYGMYGWGGAAPWIEKARRLATRA